MTTQQDFILLTAGMVLPIVFSALIFLHRRRVYATWAKLNSIIAGIAGLGWGVLGLVLSHLHIATSREVYFTLVNVKGLLGGMCVGFVLSILIARPYQKKGS